MFTVSIWLLNISSCWCWSALDGTVFYGHCALHCFR